jgi:hypothetical protein
LFEETRNHVVPFWDLTFKLRDSLKQNERSTEFARFGWVGDISPCTVHSIGQTPRGRCLQVGLYALSSSLQILEMLSSKEKSYSARRGFLWTTAYEMRGSNPTFVWSFEHA